MRAACSSGSKGCACCMGFGLLGCGCQSVIWFWSLVCADKAPLAIPPAAAGVLDTLAMALMRVRSVAVWAPYISRGIF